MKKNVNKVLSLLMSIVIIVGILPVPAAFAKDHPIGLSLGDAAGETGEQVVVPLNISAGAGLCAADFEITYDNTKLKFVAGENGPLLSSAMATLNPTPFVAGISSTIKCNLIDINGITKAGTLFNFTFEILAPLTDSTDVSATGGIFDTNSDAIAHSFYDGTVKQTGIFSYTITFDANGGIGAGRQVVIAGATPVPPQVSREGYTFVGWTPQIVAATTDATYTALWEENVVLPTTYEISFNAAGGLGGKTLRVEEGLTPTAPVVTRKGYTFVEWTPAIAPATSKTTYTALWAERAPVCLSLESVAGQTGEQVVIPLNISADSGVCAADFAITYDHTKLKFVGGEAGPLLSSAMTTLNPTPFVSGTKSTIKCNLIDTNGITKAGTLFNFTFEILPTLMVSTPVSLVSDIYDINSGELLYAANDGAVEQSNIPTFTIRFDANSGLGDDEQLLQYDKTPIAPEVTREGYAFLGWDPAITKVTKDATYTARWEKIIVLPTTYEITFNAAGGPGGKTVNVEEGLTPTAPLVTRKGYTFVEWTPAIAPATSKATYTAVWAERAPVCLSLGSASGETGEQVVIPLNISADSGVCAADFAITYDHTKLKFVGGEAGPLLSSAMTTLNPTPFVSGTRSTIKCNLIDLNGIKDAGTLFNFTFEILPALADSTPVSVTGDIYDTNSGQLLYMAHNSTIIRTGTCSYTVTFDANGGTGGGDQIVAHGMIPLAPEVRREGYTFLGWDTEIVAATQDATYVTQWEINTYTITFDANGGSGSTIETVDYGTMPAVPEVTKEGYIFLGWHPQITAATAHTTYTAQWKKISSYTITFDANGGSGSTIETVDYGTMPLAPVVSREGYIFLGWHPQITAATAHTTYTAQWKKISSYTITFDANGGTGGSEQTVDYSTMPAVPEVTKEGYIFLGWDPEIIAATQDTTYTARWAKKGDINGDGKTTGKDALLVLKHLFRTKVLTGDALLAADINGDNKITLVDFFQILFAPLRIRRSLSWLL